MNTYERPFAERLQSEAAQIPLPPRERWTPKQRARHPVLPALAAFGALAFAVLIVAPVAVGLRARGDGVAPISSGQSVGGAPPSACAPPRDRSPATCLWPGTLVEIVGHDGGLMASTPLLRVRLEDASLSARFGDPTLFETDANTQLEPNLIRTPGLQGGGTAATPTVAAIGAKVGSKVLVAFDERAPETRSGAHLLSRFVVVLGGDLPSCLIVLNIERYPRGETSSNGGPTPEAAFKAASPATVQFSMFPMGKDPKSAVWIVAGSDTFIATILTDGTWFVSPAKLSGCRDPQEVRTSRPPSSPAPTFPMNAPGVAPDPITPAQVAAGMPAGAAIFAQSDPSCVLENDGKTYRCTLRNAPAPEFSNYLGAKELLAIAGTVAGGCVGLDHDGMTWNCFLGQDAVDHEILDKGLLGQPAPFPGRG
jgi:hypothetical protein